MNPDQFASLSLRVLQLPLVATLQAKSHALLLDAMLAAGFKWVRSVPAALLPATKPAVYQGGFIVRDPVTGAELRIAVALMAVESSDGQGFCHYWEVTPVAGRKALKRLGGVRRFLMRKVRTYLLLPASLALYDEEALLVHFTKVLSSLPFTATPIQANGFVLQLTDVLAP
jgi:hypothetical protein